MTLKQKFQNEIETESTASLNMGDVLSWGVLIFGEGQCNSIMAKKHKRRAGHEMEPLNPGAFLIRASGCSNRGRTDSKDKSDLGTYRTSRRDHHRRIPRNQGTVCGPLARIFRTRRGWARVTLQHARAAIRDPQK